jgi:rare lipoprotein A
VTAIPQGAPNVPYEIKGETYEPEAADVPLTETGIASWYGKPFHGRRTATGEVYDMHAMTAAHKTMPLPSYALVRNPRNKREVVVRVNDRGPFKPGRVIDLSHAAARKLGISGIAPVEVRRLTHAEIRSGTWKIPVQRVADARSP